MEIFTKSITIIVVGLIKLYQLAVSPMIGPSCRHYPTCSQYSVEALKAHGLIRGVCLALKRILRCRPGGTHGYDPVPKRDK